MHLVYSVRVLLLYYSMINNGLLELPTPSKKWLGVGKFTWITYAPGTRRYAPVRAGTVPYTLVKAFIKAFLYVITSINYFKIFFIWIEIINITIFYLVQKILLLILCLLIWKRVDLFLFVFIFLYLNLLNLLYKMGKRYAQSKAKYN